MTGIGVSPGIAIGKALILEKKRKKDLNFNIEEKDIKGEVNKLYKAISRSIEEIEQLKKEKDEALTQQEKDILDVHIGILNDQVVVKEMENEIRCKKVTAASAVARVIDRVKKRFLEIDDEYFRARAEDIEDIGSRITANLEGKQGQNMVKIDEYSVIISDNLTPSDTIMMDRDNVIGFATVFGSVTSHTAIVANMRGIPAVVSCGESLRRVKNGDNVIIDGTSGKVVVNPSEEVLAKYRREQIKFKKRIEQLKKLKNLPAETKDKFSIKLFGNISRPDEATKVFEYGGEGIGLFRTEFLYMNRRSFPSEEEQFEAYREVAIASKSKPVVIRTLDIGGDKQLCYFDLSSENNPFLGYRAIRICLDKKDIFKTQIRAVLRASAFGDLKIMFPMISGVEEVRRAKRIVEEVKSELEKENIRFNKDIEIGIMIEIPSAAITADILAREVDFFSIGTNDLCQYTLAVDRMNEKVRDLYDPFDPSILRLIRKVITVANDNKIYAEICGEMASDPLATILLIGMGLNIFSLNAPSIPHIKERIMGISKKEANEVTNRVMELETAHDVREYLHKCLS